ncbi:hypothetical protein CLLI_23490 [Clostridium liquoris]|uniref:Uncharacterized protein n=1 Tax=Clostridium liquoris TaxID=1289519 RepID=A0A2T0B1C1_9CLOT|nr:hypothetical protein [Clostridium liquoris]PRR77436.1 hypothetical protein CLLI_23490 [Clostridium liquoris]
MKVAKSVLILSIPILLLYLLNIFMFNKYPSFFACFCASSIYIPSLDKMKSFNKLEDNFLNKEKKELSTEDFINLVLIFILTFLFTGLIFISGNHNELGFPFFGASIIFLLMSYFKFPKRFFS